MEWIGVDTREGRAEGEAKYQVHSSLARPTEILLTTKRQR